jgi:hypothetical protein
MRRLITCSLSSEIYRRSGTRPVSSFPYDRILCVVGVIRLAYRYAATRGLFYSHVGWIFYKAAYERMELVDRGDLVNDPGGLVSNPSHMSVLTRYTVVVFQHKHYGLCYNSMLVAIETFTLRSLLGTFLWIRYPHGVRTSLG